MAAGVVPAVRGWLARQLPGWLLEAAGNRRPRKMIATARAVRTRGTEFGLRLPRNQPRHALGGANPGAPSGKLGKGYVSWPSPGRVLAESWPGLYGEGATLPRTGVEGWRIHTLPR